MFSFRHRSGRLLVAGLACVATLGVAMASTGAAVAAPKPITPFTTNTIVLQKSIGGITLNAGKAKGAKGFPKKDCNDAGCSYSAPKNRYNAYFYLAAKTRHSTPYVAVITLYDESGVGKPRQLHTSKGIGIGSSRHAVKKAYPSLKSVDGGLCIGKDPRTTCFYFNDASQVTEIHMQLVHLG